MFQLLARHHLNACDISNTACDRVRSNSACDKVLLIQVCHQNRGQTVGIPMGTNCAPLLADLFLYSCENEFLDKLIKKGKRKLARNFNLSYRYTDDLISFNKKRFNEFISDIYPKELNISETTESTSVASYLDLLLLETRTTALPPNYMTNMMRLVSTL